jgi:branched-chain amino acid transport system ATP-binding protein
MGGALLSLDRVSRRFGGLVAVDDVTADVDDGELIGLIGPNGAGKTTLFNLISGVTPASAGSIHFAGQTITGKHPFEIARMGIGRTFQNLRVFPNMTVFDNVSVGAIGKSRIHWHQALARHGGTAGAAITEATGEALCRVGLAGEAAELAANLSYGKRKYLEIARALAGKPRLLILDEPAAGLNDAETAALARFIDHLNTGGLTVILVEHDMSLVMKICRRILVLASGRMIADGPPAAVQADAAVLDAYLGVDDDG